MKTAAVIGITVFTIAGVYAGLIAYCVILERVHARKPLTRAESWAVAKLRRRRLNREIRRALAPRKTETER